MSCPVVMMENLLAFGLPNGFYEARALDEYIAKTNVVSTAAR